MQPSIPLRERKRKSRARVYVLLRTVQDCAGDAVLVLRQNVGVVAVDRIEGPPDIIAVMEAAGRPKLAKAVVKALASVELMTDSVDLLPVQDGSSAASVNGVKTLEVTRNGPANQETR